MDIKIISAIIGSSVFAAIITALFTKISKDKSDKLQYVTNERKQWRDDLRDATIALRQLFEVQKTENHNSNNSSLKFTTYSEAKVYFQVRLNPNDAEDNEILGNFKDLDDEKLKTVEEGVARLLKHDWERVKHETKVKSWYTQFITVILLLFLIYQLYPIKNWIGITEDIKTDMFSMNALIVEFFSIKTLILIVLFPVLIKLAFGLRLFLLKKLSIDSKNISKTTAICTWLNIPYRGKSSNGAMEAKNGKNN